MAKSESELTRRPTDARFELLMVKGQLLFYIKRCRVASLGQCARQEMPPKREIYWSEPS